jgi:hypothetical protein
MESEGLKLRAEDAEDLAALSTLVQDAILRVGDIAYLARSRRLALTLNRFCWERASERLAGRDVYRRVTSGLHVENVGNVQAKGIDRTNPEGLIYLLALKFEPSPNGGAIELQFAGGANLRAEIEAIDVGLRDLNGGWLTEVAPRHDAPVGET